MTNEGIIHCRFHSTALNAGWCSSCGNPVCERCITTLPTWAALPAWKPLKKVILCPHCKHRKMVATSLYYILLWLFMSSFLVWFTIFDEKLGFFLIAYVISLFSYMIIRFQFMEQYSIKTFINEHKKFQSWKKTLDELPIPADTFQTLIQDKKMEPCKYHPSVLGVTTCQQCGSNMCQYCYRMNRGLCNDCYKERLLAAFQKSRRSLPRRPRRMFFYSLLTGLPISVAFILNDQFPFFVNVLALFVAIPVAIIGFEFFLREQLKWIKKVFPEQA